MSTTYPKELYKQGDPSMPGEFRDLLVKLLLDAHLENNGNPNQYRPIKQYAFHIPLEDWVDLAWFHALIDRVGLYVGIEMTGAPYEPLAKAAPELEGDEEFHTRAGFLHLREICATPEGKAAAQERLKKWWPAALDMFGRSDSKTSPQYVKWGIKMLNNEALRQKYITEAV